MEFTVYSKPFCSYCDQAKALLASKGLNYTEVIIDTGQLKDPTKQYTTVAELKNILPTVKTVPQIFKGEQHIGGFDALKIMLQS